MIIYKTTNLVNGKIYVGQSINPTNNYLGSGCLLHKAIKKYNKKNFKRETLEECSTIEELNKKEDYWIKKLKSKNKDIGYNIKDGGLNGLHSDETKKKIKKARQLQKFSEETRKKMSKAGKGRKKSEEHKRKIGEANKGKVYSIEIRKIMSEKKKELLKDKTKHPMFGKKHSEESKQKMRDARLGKKFPRK